MPHINVATKQMHLASVVGREGQIKTMSSSCIMSNQVLSYKSNNNMPESEKFSAALVRWWGRGHKFKFFCSHTCAVKGSDVIHILQKEELD
jgi:hypothetical protein